MKVSKGISWAILIASSFTGIGQQPVTSQGPKTSPNSSQTTVPVPTSSAVPAASAEPVPPPASDLKSTSVTQTVPAPASGTTPVGVDNSTYIIGAEDALQITVWREPTLSGNLPVRPDGKISMVLLGDLPAAGMTPTQLGTDIAQRLHKFVQDPSVTVQVMAVNSQRIYMIGEVGHVGPIALSAAMTPLQAIATAGGLSPFANSKHIYILRGAGSTQQKIPFNYKQALKGDDRQRIVLRPGDTIVVP